jgi:hypothetical protein
MNNGMHLNLNNYNDIQPYSESLIDMANFMEQFDTVLIFSSESKHTLMIANPNAYKDIKVTFTDDKMVKFKYSDNYCDGFEEVTDINTAKIYIFKYSRVLKAKELSL